jgi:hypothetical protein
MVFNNNRSVFKLLAFKNILVFTPGLILAATAEGFPICYSSSLPGPECSASAA